MFLACLQSRCDGIEDIFCPPGIESQRKRDDGDLEAPRAHHYLPMTAPSILLPPTLVPHPAPGELALAAASVLLSTPTTVTHQGIPILALSKKWRPKETPTKDKPAALGAAGNAAGPYSSLLSPRRGSADQQQHDPISTAPVEGTEYSGSSGPEQQAERDATWPPAGTCTHALLPRQHRCSVTWLQPPGAGVPLLQAATQQDQAQQDVIQIGVHEQRHTAHQAQGALRSAAAVAQEECAQSRHNGEAQCGTLDASAVAVNRHESSGTDKDGTPQLNQASPSEWHNIMAQRCEQSRAGMLQQPLLSYRQQQQQQQQQQQPDVLYRQYTGSALFQATEAGVSQQHKQQAHPRPDKQRQPHAADQQQWARPQPRASLDAPQTNHAPQLPCAQPPPKQCHSKDTARAPIGTGAGACIGHVPAPVPGVARGPWGAPLAAAAPSVPAMLQWQQPGAPWQQGGNGSGGRSSGQQQQHVEFALDDLKFGPQVGEGGYGKVYFGTVRSTGQPVAIKLLSASHSNGHVVLEEFWLELRAMLALPSHPNVLRLVGACTLPPQLALITEFCAQGSLYGLLHSPSILLTWQQMLHMLHGAALGMEHLHRHSVLHRDVKSGNLLVDERFDVRVADFGLSRTAANIGHLTGGLGTLQWMAPEVMANQPYSDKADVYSFAIVMLELVTWRLPYAGMAGLQAAIAVLNRGMRPDIPPHTPPALAALIKACWSASPQDRPSFSGVAQQLFELQASLGSEQWSAQPPQPPQDTAQCLVQHQQPAAVHAQVVEQQQQQQQHQHHQGHRQHHQHWHHHPDHQSEEV